MSPIHSFVFITLNIFWLLYVNNATQYCHEILKDKYVKQINWPYLRQCLTKLNGEDISKEMGENIWRLMKVAFDTLDNIPAESYRYMGYSLTFIPDEELRNISLETIDIVEAFGVIRSSDNRQHQNGFRPEQLYILAHKVRKEWLGKNPSTYSEYDLMAMGEILCYLNVNDIENIHADAFKEAAEWIGMIEKCPQDRLQALADLAKRPEAFGEPNKWSKIEVSFIGNIINGLTSAEINSISKDKLQLNSFYKISNHKEFLTNRTSSSSDKGNTQINKSNTTNYNHTLIINTTNRQ